MHELAISEDVCRMIEEEAGRRGIKKVAGARLKIGRMRAFEKHHLEICLKGRPPGSAIDGMDFCIEEVPVVLECASCRKHFTDARFDDASFAHKISHAPCFYMPPACPSCGAGESKMISGNEMELVSISK